MTSRTRPGRFPPRRDTVAFVPPPDAVEFIPPEDGVLVDSSSVAPPPAAVSSPPTAEPTWWEAAFPRSSASADLPAWMPQSLAGAALDVVDLPLRANAARVRPSDESYAQAMARIGARPDASGTFAATDAMARDPSLVPMLAMSGGTGAIPAWLSRFGWAGRGIAQGVPVGAAMAGTRQAENVAAGRPISALEAAGDVGIGAGFGVAAEIPALAGRAAITGAKRGLQQIIKPGTAKQGQEINDFRRALDAGLLPEMAGFGNVTAQGAGMRFGERLAAKELAYPKVLAAADATGQRVGVGRAMNRATDDISEQMASGRLPSSFDEAQEAMGWVADRAAIPDDPAVVLAAMKGGPMASAVNLAPSVAQARKSALWKEAFKDPTKSTARGAATKATARSLAEELGKISPDLAALNAEMAPWYAAAPAMIRASGPRGNAYGIGPMEALGFIGGTGVGASQEGIGGGVGGGLGALLAVRALRSPAAMRALYESGRGAIASTPFIRRAVPLAASATDNARGR